MKRDRIGRKREIKWGEREKRANLEEEDKRLQNSEF